MSTEEGLSTLCGSALGRYLYEKASLVLMILDESGRILDANRYASELVGQELRGRLFSQVVIDFSGRFDFKEVIEPDERVHLLNMTSSNGLPQTLYFSFLRQHGRVLVVAEHNHLEVEELRKSFIDLNADFSNLNRALQKRNVELSRVNEVKNYFLSMAAHDLRNPVSAICTLSDFLSDEAAGKLEAKQANFIAAIQKSSRFMLNLLDELLDIARIEAGRLEINKRPSDISALVAECVELNRVLAGKRGITVDLLAPSAALPSIDLDAVKIQQVVHNLISNAIRYSPDDSTVTVGIAMRGEAVEVSVSDHGPGIPADELEKLYKPFSRTSVKPLDGEKSTGLGLAIAHKIVLEHRGKAWVESVVGKGSTFYFSLPLQPAEKKGELR
ncbi:hypothetical protein CKO15_08615 [Halorhodospira abdelmalekii]|uniref:PAS domain-containing sensor histidine kinase n=1 Tax=Halorhodospira abdelmalekii TaxID=421629 RepID=UPI0019036E71|nr:PAS domain-containing sensor histidine kinase [Halorhodospira abdelmalekii]MBK1735343.1 hypothetical protein [Halorhodospira abdelmalekii]